MIANIDIPAIQRRRAFTAALLVLLQADDGGELPWAGGGLNEGVVVGEDGDALEKDGFDGLCQNRREGGSEEGR